ncbi:sigma-70 family RNA polymerase sigma factor [Stenotrophomonas sp. HITSZ_GD]|uniref:RNA polymerase sigma factor n=1 Tax=Stenotrophomonas sp. HITSZ_GD TaxID=3037248 RepID=UPI00240E0886|nr:sigma-70 family RNA polymerase sigma factor [Stenotrophomonas sp. HITSZ_GD]MDG2525078.1 sigma-70 family RNA polymerase sigma factor [Stenotrophomonas sp. HITSZ_GD]
MGERDVHSTLNAVWRMEAAKIIAALARQVRDVGLAEELAQDALVAALERWPTDGIPDNPGAWLMTTARNRAIDRLRHAQLQRRKRDALGYEIEREQQAVQAAQQVDPDDDIGDDLLRLMFVACHPSLGTDARVALTLRMLGGLATDEIARAFLVPEPTVAQRIVRAKRTLSERQVPFEVPRGEERDARLGSVLEVLYLIFNEGYAATAGDDLMRPRLCDEALRLCRVLARLAPRDPEVHGLLALMALQASRQRARVDAQGAPVLLADQDRGRWDRLLIRHGLTALARARALGGEDGAYVLQAAIAACHARARRFADTDWREIAALYARLAVCMPSPVVELNRAVAVSMAEGAEAALPLVDALAAHPAMRQYHLLPTVRGDLLEKLGRHEEARAAFAQAAALARNAREKALLEARAASL